MQIELLQNAITNALTNYLGITIIIELSKILLLWMIIKSAVKAGIKEAINAPTPEQQIKQAKDDFEKEMEGWS